MKILMGALLVSIAVIGSAPFAKLLEGPPEQVAPGRSEAKPLPHVEVARPQKKTIYRKLDLPGEVLPNQQVGVFARVTGYLESMAVDRGSFVKAGDVLLKIGVPDLEMELSRQVADLAVQAPSIARDEAFLSWRESIWKRLEEAAKKTPDLVNQELLDDARGRFETARAELALTRAKALGMEATAEKTRTLIGFATIRAPFDGVVTERWADPGELIQPGSTKMLHVMQTDPVRIRIHVPQSDIPSIRADSRAKLTFSELPGRVFELPASRLFWALQKSTKTMAAEFDLRNAESLVRPGMYAQVRVDLDARPDALVLPAGALVVEKKKSFVFVVREGTARKIPVKVGIDDGLEFEVLDGLKPEDEVIVVGKNLISDGEAVRTSKRP